MKWFGRKKDEAQRSNAKQECYVNLATLLTDEEQHLLVTDLEQIENKTPLDSRYVVAAVKELVQEKRPIAPQIISLCIAAVQDALNTFSVFGMVPSGHSSLLEKLKKAQETAENK